MFQCVTVAVTAERWTRFATISDAKMSLATWQNNLAWSVTRRTNTWLGASTATLFMLAGPHAWETARLTWRSTRAGTLAMFAVKTTHIAARWAVNATLPQTGVAAWKNKLAAILTWMMVSLAISTHSTFAQTSMTTWQEKITS